MSRTPRMFEQPRDYRPAIERIERHTAARLRDYGTAQNFALRGSPPASYEPAPLFDPEPEPDRGPAPLPGQLSMTPKGDPTP